MSFPRHSATISLSRFASVSSSPSCPIDTVEQKFYDAREAAIQTAEPWSDLGAPGFARRTLALLLAGPRTPPPPRSVLFRVLAWSLWIRYATRHEGADPDMKNIIPTLAVADI